VDSGIAKSASSGSMMMGLVTSCAVLSLAIAPAAILIAAICGGGFTGEAFVSAGVAYGVCWLAAAAVLSATFLGNQFHAPVHGMLVGMLVKMLIMLAAIVAIPRLGGPLGPPSIAPTILGVYLVALVIVTTLSVRMVPRQPRAVKAL